MSVFKAANNFYSDQLLNCLVPQHKDTFILARLSGVIFSLLDRGGPNLQHVGAGSKLQLLRLQKLQVRVGSSSKPSEIWRFSQRKLTSSKVCLMEIHGAQTVPALNLEVFPRRTTAK